MYTEKQVLNIKLLLDSKDPKLLKRILEQNDFYETALANIEGHTLFSMILSKKNWELLNLV
jgi:hypothetical protein